MQPLRQIRFQWKLRLLTVQFFTFNQLIKLLSLMIRKIKKGSPTPRHVPELNHRVVITTSKLLQISEVDFKAVQVKQSYQCTLTKGWGFMGETAQKKVQEIKCVDCRSSASELQHPLVFLKQLHHSAEENSLTEQNTWRGKGKSSRSHRRWSWSAAARHQGSTPTDTALCP